MASRDLADAAPELVTGFQSIKRIFEANFPKYELRPTCTYRPPAEQKAAFDAGRSDIDGIRKKGNHNYHPSRAIDVGIFRKNPAGAPASYIDDLLTAKKFDADLHRSLYWNFSQLVQHFGFRSGNDWDGDGMPVEPDPDESLVDPYHMELTK